MNNFTVSITSEKTNVIEPEKNEDFNKFMGFKNELDELKYKIRFQNLGLQKLIIDLAEIEKNLRSMGISEEPTPVPKKRGRPRK